MVNFSFSIYDLEYFLLILTRISCFVFAAPFFSMRNTPMRVRVGISVFTAVLLYQSLTPSDYVEYNTVLEYAVIVMKEAVVGLLVGLGASICTSIMNFAGAIADMETGLSMVTLLDPSSRLFDSSDDCHRDVPLFVCCPGRYLHPDSGKRSHISWGHAGGCHAAVFG